MSSFDFMKDLSPADLTGVPVADVLESIRTMNPEHKVEVIAAVDEEIERRRKVGRFADGVLVALRIVRTLLA